MATNQLAAATVICIFHSVLHSADYQTFLSAQIKECVVECGLILLGTEICPRVGKYNLVINEGGSKMIKIVNLKEKTQNLPTDNNKSALFMNIIFMLFTSLPRKYTREKEGGPTISVTTSRCWNHLPIKLRTSQSVKYFEECFA